ncbi:AP-2 complex subunit alpha-2 [Babesia sp. Xinjiang]|uniref:AP-2 complex subunit alpha-2 n=1 Tax=Babesia sp. Xinjiang TaxID=462227 RepID=UPI000A260C4C|nr:AP-2 complex subunit alpha-2 [Babesia sp. Xinjiang]ORM41209.1 AP-2 complex subunit alpha-2 [Babesia sp. Xinjiang]
MASQPVRGLVKFITDLNGCPTGRERDYRVKGELSKIRSRFDERGLSGYDKKKCILKLLYIHMLGYGIDLGYVESVQLMASSSFQEKIAGYMGCEVLLGDMDDVRRLGINTTLDDLRSQSEHVQALALNHIANSSCSELREQLYEEVIRRLLVSPFESNMLRKKLYMCVLQFVRLDNTYFPLHDWKRKMFDLLSRETDFGCLMALVNLLMEFVRLKRDMWDHCMPLVIEALMRLLSGSVAADSYYNVTSPWLLQKLLSVLAYVEPSSDARYRQTLVHVLDRLVDRITSLPIPVSSMRATAEEQDDRMAWMLHMSIALETVRAIVNWLPHIPSFSVTPIMDFIRHLLASRSSHICINAIEMSEIMLCNDDLVQLLKEQLSLFLRLLGSNDPTLKCRIVSMVSRLCDENNWAQILPEFLSVLRVSDARTQNVLIPHLLDALGRNVPLGPLYIDFVFKIVNFTHVCSALEDIPRVLYGKSEEFGKLVASKCVEVLSKCPVNDAMLRICSTMIGEYGHLIDSVYPLSKQSSLLERYFVLCSDSTKAIVLFTLAKCAARDSSIYARVERFLESQVIHHDAYVQSTACELLRLMILGAPFFQNIVIGNHGKYGAPNILALTDGVGSGSADSYLSESPYRIGGRGNQSVYSSDLSSSSFTSSYETISSV